MLVVQYEPAEPRQLAPHPHQYPPLPHRPHRRHWCSWRPTPLRRRTSVCRCAAPGRRQPPFCCNRLNHDTSGFWSCDRPESCAWNTSASGFDGRRLLLTTKSAFGVPSLGSGCRFFALGCNIDTQSPMGAAHRRQALK